MVLAIVIWIIPRGAIREGGLVERGLFGMHNIVNKQQGFEKRDLIPFSFRLQYQLSKFANSSMLFETFAILQYLPSDNIFEGGLVQNSIVNRET